MWHVIYEQPIKNMYYKYHFVVKNYMNQYPFRGEKKIVIKIWTEFTNLSTISWSDSDHRIFNHEFFDHEIVAIPLLYIFMSLYF